MVWLSRLFDWEDALAVVKPATFIRWHRQGFKLPWRWKSRPVGRPPIPENLQELILRTATESPTWGQERIASELLLKIGTRVSPRTVAKYMPGKSPGHRRRLHNQNWKTFLRNHGKAVGACDFLHTNVTPNPTADWTIQQPRDTFPWEHGYEWLIHDRAGTFSPAVDRTIEGMGMEVIKTSP